MRRSSGLLSRASVGHIPDFKPTNARGECYEEGSYGSLIPGPFGDGVPKTRCCNTFGSFATDSGCQNMLESLSDLCGANYEDRRHRILDECCISTAWDEALAMSPTGPPCEGAGGDVPGDTGSGGGSGGGGAESGGNESTSDNHSCGSRNQEGGLTGQIIDGAFDLASQGMCALWTDSCANANGSPVYCGDVYQNAGARDPNAPGWVPGWYPAGYSESEYLQFTALAGLGVVATGLLASSLFGALFASDGEEEKPAAALPAASGGGSGGSNAGGSGGGANVSITINQGGDDDEEKPKPEKKQTQKKAKKKKKTSTNQKEKK